VELIVTDEARRDVAEIGDFDLDLAFGDTQNDFVLTTREGPRLTAGCLVYVDGTEYGGVIDDITSDGERVSYSGRTWHGILAGKVLSPLPGQDYLAIAGDAASAIGTLIGMMGLGDLFRATGGGRRLSGTYQFDRYTDGYRGMCRMLRESGMRLGMVYEDGGVSLSPEPIAVYGDDVDSDRATFRSKRRYRNVNHLVCLGKGELRDRAVVHLYADGRGIVSQAQTFRGVEERAETYEMTTSEAPELLAKGTERLRELQLQGEIDVTAEEGGSYAVGDYITGRDNGTGELVTSEVTKKVLRVEGGMAAVEYECGMGRPSGQVA